MEELYNLGINYDTICSMLELNPYLIDLTKKEVKEKIELLKNIDCTNDEIIDIISTNPIFLNRTNKEILDLIKCLKEFKFSNLNILFDSNPFILNLEPFEVNNYILSRSKNENLEDIVDDLETNTYLFDEM